MLKQKKRTAVLLLLAFLIPTLLFGCVMVLCRVAPFGDRTLLIWDADGQYSAFLAAWRRVLTGRGDAFYALDKGIGGSMAGLTAYYLASPLNAALALFPEGAIVAAFHGLVLLKIGLSGLAFMYFLRKKDGAGKSGLLFSTTYALMGYTACYFWNVMWLDGVVMLPLMVLGVRRVVVERGNPLLYILALGTAIWCNYYIGFMLCVFAVVMFVYLYLEQRLNGARPSLARAAGSFTAASLLAGGLAAFMLIPAFAALNKGYQVFGTEENLTARLFPMAEMATKLFTGAVSYDQIRSDLPNIYIGLPVLALFGSYGLNTAIPRKRRALSAGLVGVFLVSFQISGLNLFWHGMDLPQAMPARFSFLFCFVMVMLAYESFRTLPKALAEYRLAGRMGWLAAGFFGFVCLLFTGELPPYLAYETLCADVACFLAACGLISLLGGSRRRVCMAGLCALQAACLVINGYFSIHRLEAVDLLRLEENTAYMEKAAGLVERVRSQDEGLYRMERNDTRSDNDPLLFGYHGLSHYSSDFDSSSLRFLARIGLYQIHYRMWYASGTTPVLEGLLGVKYILRTDERSLEALPGGYAELWRDGNVSAWRNPYALSLAFMAPGGGLDDVTESDDPFVNQNRLVSDLSGIDAPVFTPLEDVSFRVEGNMMHADFQQRANTRYYMQARGSWFSLDGAPLESGERFFGCVALPIAGEDKQTTLTAYLGEGEAHEGSLYVAAFDEAAFERAWEKVARGMCDVSSPTDSRINVKARAHEGRTQLVLTVPYDAGWSVEVDGKPAQTTTRYGHFLAVDLEEGEHEATLRFFPAGLKAGLAVSLVCALLTAVWQLCLKKRGRVRRACERAEKETIA